MDREVEVVREIAVGGVAGTVAVADEMDRGVFARGEVGPAGAVQHVAVEVLSRWLVFGTGGGRRGWGLGLARRGSGKGGAWVLGWIEGLGSVVVCCCRGLAFGECRQVGEAYHDLVHCDMVEVQYRVHRRRGLD